MVPQNKVKDLILKHSKLETELSSGKIDKKYFAEKGIKGELHETPWKNFG